MPLVSVCIPAYNRPDYLQQAISSVIAQSFVDWELIISDDHSPIDLTNIVSTFTDPRIRFIRQPKNLGMVDNWNATLGLSRGSFVKMLMDDDVLEIDCLEKQVVALQSNQKVAVVCSDYQTIDKQGQTLQNPNFLENSFRLWKKDHRESGLSFIRHFLMGNRRVGLPSSILFRRAAANALHGFRHEAGAAADIDLWLQLCNTGDFVYVDKKLLQMRIHDTNLLRKRELENDAFRDILFIYRDNLKKFGHHFNFRIYKTKIFKNLITRLQPFFERSTKAVRDEITNELTQLGFSKTQIHLLSSRP